MRFTTPSLLKSFGIPVFLFFETLLLNTTLALLKVV